MNIIAITSTMIAGVLALYNISYAGAAYHNGEYQECIHAILRVFLYSGFFFTSILAMKYTYKDN